MRSILALLVFILISTAAFAQINITGVVLDSATNEPLQRALISSGSAQAVADKDGVFELVLTSDGIQTFAVQHVGCETKLYTLNLKNDTFITFYLPHHIHAFSEAIAVGHGKTDPTAYFVQTIQQTKLEHQATINLSDALENVNGVSFLKTGNTISKPVINGMHSNRISVINDDSKQEGQQWGAEHAPEIDPLSTGVIEVIKGANLLKYGNDAIGGVVRLLPSPFGDESQFSINLISKMETNPLGGILGLRIEKNNAEKHIGQRLVFNAKRNADGQAPRYVLSNTGFGQYSGSHYLSVGHEDNQLSIHTSAFVQELGILASSHIGNVTDLERALSSDTPLIVNPRTFSISSPSQKIQHYSSKLKWSKHLHGLGELKSSYTIQNNRRQEFDKHNNQDEAALDLNLWTQQFNASVSTNIKKAGKLEYGLMGESQQNTYTGRYFIPNYNRSKAGVFVVSSMQTDKALLEAGIRYDWQKSETYRYVDNELVNDNLHFEGLSATIAASAKISEDVGLNIAVGTRFRSPDVNELFSDGLHHGTATIERGDLNLSQERVYSVNVTAKYNHNRWRIQLEPYYYYFNNYIYLQPQGDNQLTIRGAFPVFNYVQTNAAYVGGDLDIRFNLASRWTAEVKSSVVNIRDLTNETYVFGIPAPQAALTLRYLFPSFLGVSNGQWWINASHTAKQQWAEATDFAPSPDAYTLLNTQFGGYLFESQSTYFSLGIKNILNTSYRDYMNRYRYYADEVGFNFYITINYNFNKKQ